VEQRKTAPNLHDFEGLALLKQTELQGIFIVKNKNVEVLIISLLQQNKGSYNSLIAPRILRQPTATEEWLRCISFVGDRAVYSKLTADTGVYPVCIRGNQFCLAKD
jgi:hypothetical protein